MRAETPAELMLATKWAQVPIYTWLLSILWFVRIYLGAGRTLARLDDLRRAHDLSVDRPFPGSERHLSRQSGSRHIQFLGESVTVAHGAPSPWLIFGMLSAGLMLVFLADATITAWRRGDRQKAVMVGGSAEFFLLMAPSQLHRWYGESRPAPIVLSLPYMAMIAVMGYELSRDVLRASDLVVDLAKEQSTDFGPLRPPHCGAGIRTDPNRPRSSR